MKSILHGYGERVRAVLRRRAMLFRDLRTARQELCMTIISNLRISIAAVARIFARGALSMLAQARNALRRLSPCNAV